MAAATAVETTLSPRARDVLKRAGNPFRNYFARNPDDEVCARYHVPELFAAERDLLQAIIDLYRDDPMTHSEVVPVLGNKGAGKTHLLHSIKHGTGGQWQLLVTPGVYQKDSDFLEYLLFQIIDTLLGGGKQKGIRPLDFVGEQLVRRQLGVALRDLSPAEKLELFPPILGRLASRLGFGKQQAHDRADWLAENLSGYSNFARMPIPLTQALAEAGLTPEKAFELVTAHVAKHESHNTAGLMRRHIFAGFAKAALLKDESDLASFLTFGFAELDFQVRPTRQDLVLALFKVLTEIFRSLKTPVVVAFDQLEDLLLARRSDDAHKTAESFFAGIVQVMHQIDGLLFTIFAERGLWNRFVPSLDGYIQDRLNNPVHVAKHGTVKTIRLEAPTAELARRVVEARLAPCLNELPQGEVFNDITPFTDEQVMRVAATEPTLRDMLQQYRHLFDHIVYGPEDGSRSAPSPLQSQESGDRGQETEKAINRIESVPLVELPPDASNRVKSLIETPPVDVTFKQVTVVETPADPPAAMDEEPLADAIEETDDTPDSSPTPVSRPLSPDPAVSEVPPVETFPVAVSEEVSPVVKTANLTHAALVELWEQEQRAARRKLEPEGALTGATRELQAGLGAFLAACHEHGVKVGPWRLQHVVAEWSFGDHPTYGVVTIAHWACKGAQPWKVGIGLFLARGAGKPKDLEVKLSVMDVQPTMVDHLILHRPEDDLALGGKSKSMWQDAERRGQHARLEPASLDGFAQLYSFPRWLAAVRESLPEGIPLPNLADVIQEKCEKLLEQVCMPVQG
jgi:hypothetical protein